MGFINKDTYEGEINNPLSLNLYTYVENNPLKYHDPSGNTPTIEDRSGGGSSGVTSSAGKVKKTNVTGKIPQILMVKKEGQHIRQK